MGERPTNPPKRVDGATAPPDAPHIGVEIAGTGLAVPDGKLTNHDLTKYMDTSDEWIRQRTGIVERRICDPAKGETTRTLGVQALSDAITNAGIAATDIDMLIFATVSGEHTCPAVACRVAAEVGAVGAGAFDIAAACSGFVYSLNIAHDLIRGGNYGTIAVVGCDAMSRIVDFSDRSTGILFGDAAGAAILRRSDDSSKGVLCQGMYADGSTWSDLFIPGDDFDLPEGHSWETGPPPGKLRMEGRKIYKFAVGRFPKLIEETLARANVSADEVDYYVCHQSNARMLEAARERINVAPEKMPINIDRYGNCSGGSVATVFHELRQSGQATPGQLVMFVAFGGGLTWASSLWRL